MDIDSGSDKESEHSGAAQVVPITHVEGAIEIESFDSDPDWD